MELGKYHHNAMNTKQGQMMNKVIEEAVHDTIESGERGNLVGAHIDNERLAQLEPQWDVAEKLHDKFEQRFKAGYEQRAESLAKTQQIANLKKALEAFKAKHGQAIHKEIDFIKATLDAHTKVTDVPQH